MRINGDSSPSIWYNENLFDHDEQMVPKRDR
jgi:hypothetical protein